LRFTGDPREIIETVLQSFAERNENPAHDYPPKTFEELLEQLKAIIR